jgi:beta-carotene 3-hydroxylase
MIVNLLLFVATFFFMEFTAWFAHKYIMHGLLWNLHEDHHVKRDGFFEKNDSFFLIFAIPSWLFTMFGMMANYDFKFYIGIGILAYGICYFLVHDVLIHRRFKWFDKVQHPYFKAIRKAHKVHHKHLVKEDGECFGMLIVPTKYLAEAKAASTKKHLTA